MELSAEDGKFLNCTDFFLFQVAAVTAGMFYFSPNGDPNIQKSVQLRRFRGRRGRGQEDYNNSAGGGGDSGKKKWNRGPLPSAEDLDKEMDAYNKERQEAAQSTTGFSKMAID